jgi:hypothetical protein
MRANPLLIGLCYLAMALLNGCGPSYVTPQGAKIQGKIVKGGQPLQVPGRESGTGYIEVNMSPADPAQVGQLPDTSGMAAADGSFLIEYERGLPPGKYKLAVYQRDQGGDSDQLQGKFSRQNSPIIVDIDKSKIGGTIDLGTIDLDTPKK